MFAAVIDEDKDPAAIVEERGMKQRQRHRRYRGCCRRRYCLRTPTRSLRYKEGNTKLIGFFVGQCMKEMRGQGNPKVINQILAKKLG